MIYEELLEPQICLLLNFPKRGKICKRGEKWKTIKAI